MIEWLYRKIFIAIVSDRDGYDVRAIALKQNKVLQKEAKRFDGENAFEEMHKFLRKQMDDTPLHYIALLNSDPHQGAISGCSLHNIDHELSGAKTLCRNQKWLLHTSLSEIDALKKRFSEVGIDYLFSPFSIIEHFFHDKISTGLALYALAQKDSFSVAIFDEGILEFAHHYPLHVPSEETNENIDGAIGFTVGIEEEVEKGIDLDEIESLDDLDIIDELDGLSDIEDLDSLEEIAEFSEDEPTLEEKRSSALSANTTKSEMDRFGDDYLRFELIQKTLKTFYVSEQCRNRFIETVYIADGYGSGSELKSYLEEELFLNVLIRRIDLGDEVIALAMSEDGQ
ncbi:MAG: hypothetical protein IE884_01375 [Sulfuricurvum sp.]|nr:hypothetical protein [Sulfuricurvum sp.]